MQPRTHRHRHARRGETRRQRKRADVKRSAATRAQSGRTAASTAARPKQKWPPLRPEQPAAGKRKFPAAGGERPTGEENFAFSQPITSPLLARSASRGGLYGFVPSECACFFIPYEAFVPGEAPHREGYIYFGSERSGRSTTLGGGDRSGRVISWSLSVRSRASHLAIPLIRASKDTKNS